MKKISFENYETTFKSDIEKICLEASVLSNMTSTIKNVFPNFLQKLSTSFAQVDSIPEVKVKLPQVQQFVINHMDDKQYLDLADLMIKIPEGFVGNFAEYADTLNEISKTHLAIVDTVLKPFIIYLSHFISNKDAKLSTTDTTNKYLTTQKTRNSCIDMVASFNTGQSVATAKLGSVFSRKADILQTYIKVATLTQTLAKTDLKVIQDHVKNCVELLNIVINQVESGKIVNVTPEVTRNLAFSALEIAEEIEFMSLMHFKALGFVASVEGMSMTVSNFINGNH